MSLHLHCKRSKMFIRHDGERAEQVLCPVNATTIVPDWVKDDVGYKHGVKDKSIIDLTPPKAPKETKAAPVEAEKEAPAPVVADDEDDDSSEEAAEGEEVVEEDDARKEEPSADIQKPVPAPRPKGLQGGGKKK